MNSKPDDENNSSAPSSHSWISHTCFPVNRTQIVNRLPSDGLLANDTFPQVCVATPTRIESVHSQYLMPLSPGTQLGRYEILEPIGAGGMGEVYRARDLRLGRDVAIKVLIERFSGRFEREARAIAALNHPHICTLYDVGPDYLVMEYLHGKPPCGPLAIEDAVRLAIEIASALETAHKKNILHRDLKPGNILLTENGPKLLDFGLAYQPADSDSDATKTMEGVVIGTAA